MDIKQRSNRLRMTLAASALLAAACGGSDGAPTAEPGGEPPADEDGVFESSSPNGAAASADDGTNMSTNGATGPGAGVAETGGAVAPPGGTPAAADGNVTMAPTAESTPTPAQNPERAIEEADIIKLDGDTLYALSQYGGLSVIDVSDPSDLRSLGTHRALATPFEMYVRDGIAFVLYNGYGEYTYDDATEMWTWYQTSYVVALDATSPGNIEEIGRFGVAGYISDSRIVGDILYVAAFEDGYCWNCDEGPRTNLIALDVGQPSEIAQVDELSFEEQQNTYGWRKSLSSTDERMYIAGPAWGGTEQPEGSVIQIVDISDPGGDMQLGASVEVGGQIESRWQMDEYEGVLRVISQPFTWRTDMVPVVETFSVEASDSIAPLASLPLVLPRPERLQSVRFDGDRAYAITFEQTDPLFTIDLSDPAEPVQRGELEMPGWVYYMHPAGNRVLGLGFDQGNEDGGLTVSLFDVSDLDTPTMLDRVNFGGEWAQLAEDQDRIHKSFNVMDDQDLLLVPFSGWSYTENEDELYCGRGEYQSGVQLVDWDGEADTLALRGVAPARGQARRGFLHNDALFAMSDDRLETFDVADRDNPSSEDAVPLALRVDQAAGTGDTIVRVGTDWWTGVTEVTTTSLDAVSAFEGAAELELPQLNEEGCYSGSWLNEVRTGEDKVFFVYQRYSWDPNSSESEESTRIVTVDVDDPSAPSVAGDTELGFVPSYYYGYVPGLVTGGQALVSKGNTLIFSDYEYTYDDQGYPTSESFGAKVVDMSDPEDPSVSDVELPLGRGASGFLIDGDVVATSHFETSPNDPDSVRFYLDRIDVSDPSEPELLDPVNIPGSLLAYDSESERAFSVDYRDIVSTTTEQRCYSEEGGWFEYPANINWETWNYETSQGACHVIMQTLRLLAIEDGQASIIDSYELARGESVGRSALGDDRLFIALSTQSYYGGIDGGVAVATPAIGPSVGVAGGIFYGYSSFSAGSAKLLVLGGMRSGELVATPMEIETGQEFYGGYLNQLVAVGQRALLASGWQGKLTVVDASDAEAPTVRRDVDVYGYIQDLDVVGNVAVASLGSGGVQTIRLDD